MTSFQFNGARPKGLWKVRGTQHPRLANPLTTTIVVNTPFNIAKSEKKEQDISPGDTSSDLTLTSSKRRCTSISPLPSEEIRVPPVVYWDYSHICSTQPERLNKWNMGGKFMDTSTIVGPGQTSPIQDTFSLEDWKDLRDLATEAKNIYDDHNLSDAIHILRSVIHECHRCLKSHPDPSVIFAAPLHKKKVEAPPPPPPPPIIREWFNDPALSAASRRSQGQGTTLFPLASPPPEAEECPCVDLPTAFHTVLGTALFTFGCIIDVDPSLALDGEPKIPTPYWLTAIDVYESGESLPIRTSGRIPKSMPEDWRMSMGWGRTLVKLATELLKRREENPGLREPPAMPDYSNFEVPPPSLPTPFMTYTADEPDWPRTSLFATISFLRPPFTRRLSLDKLSPDEIMTFAEDHLSRAIFHMPHPRNVVPARYPNHPLAPATEIQVSPPRSPTPDVATERSGPDRPHEIYTMAYEMHLVAENSETPGGRFRWARWADGVMSRVTVEPSMRPQKFLDLRARCNLIMGMAKMEELVADWDNPDVLHTEDAEDGRDYFKHAATFFEQAIALIEEDERNRMEFDSDSEEEEEERGKASGVVHNDNSDLYRMKSLRSEALIGLGKLTPDSTVREELYTEAKRAGGRRTVGDHEHDLDEGNAAIDYTSEDHMDED